MQNNELLTHEFFMRQALQEAQQAFDKNEVPIGAVIVAHNQIIGKGHNLTEQLKDVSAHAELLALTAAANFLGTKYLNDCTLYVTVEPCVMCAGALAWAQIGTIVYGAAEPKTGFSKYEPSLLHPKTKLVKNVLGTACADLIQTFFKIKR